MVKSLLQKIKLKKKKVSLVFNAEKIMNYHMNVVKKWINKFQESIRWPSIISIQIRDTKDKLKVVLKSNIPWRQTVQAWKQVAYNSCLQ